MGRSTAKHAKYSDRLRKTECLDLMEEGLQCKFTENEQLKSFLLNTGSTTLIECNPWDSYWDTGKTHVYGKIDHGKQQRKITLVDYKWTYKTCVKGGIKQRRARIGIFTNIKALL